MRQAILLFVAVALTFQLGHCAVSGPLAQSVAQGATGLMAFGIAGTFLWLWAARATPLALGMALSWAGAGMLPAWWWAYALLGRPPGMAEHPMFLNFLALYLVGAVLHFLVIARSFDLQEKSMVIPLLLSAALAWAVSVGF